MLVDTSTVEKNIPQNNLEDPPKYEIADSTYASYAETAKVDIKSFITLWAAFVDRANMIEYDVIHRHNPLNKCITKKVLNKYEIDSVRMCFIR